MNWLPFWYVFCAMLPLNFQLIWIVFLSQLVVTLDSLCLPCYELTCLHVQHTTAHRGKSAECALEYTYTSRYVKLCCSRLQHSRKELLSVAPCSLHPSATSCIRDLGIGRRLPKIRSHRAGRREQRKITFCVVVETGLFHRHRQVKLYPVSYPLLLLLLPVLSPSTVKT